MFLNKLSNKLSETPTMAIRASPMLDLKVRRISSGSSDSPKLKLP